MTVKGLRMRKVIRKGKTWGDGLAGAISVEIDDKKRIYTKYVNERAGKAISFDYAFYKAETLWYWLLSKDIKVDRPMAESTGTIAGFNDYLRLTEYVELQCSLRGIDCEAMLHPQLIGLEDSKVIIDDGKSLEVRYIRMLGKHIKYHVLVKEGKTTGARAKGVYKSVSICRE
jgi:hypothetical protein